MSRPAPPPPSVPVLAVARLDLAHRSPLRVCDEECAVLGQLPRALGIHELAGRHFTTHTTFFCHAKSGIQIIITLALFRSDGV